MTQKCKQCGQMFELSDSEIAFFNRKGLDLPRRCAYCRKNNRDRRGYTAPSMPGIQQVREVDPGFHHPAPDYGKKNTTWKKTGDELPFWKQQELTEKQNKRKNPVLVFCVILAVIVIVFATLFIKALQNVDHRAYVENHPQLTEQVKPTYYLNTYRRKFHRPGCESVQQMMDENRQEFYGTREEAIAQGYSPCNNCKP